MKGAQISDEAANSRSKRRVDLKLLSAELQSHARESYFVLEAIGFSHKTTQGFHIKWTISVMREVPL